MYTFLMFEIQSEPVSFLAYLKPQWCVLSSRIQVPPSGDREALIARQEFIQQLALWDVEETTALPAPIPGAEDKTTSLCGKTHFQLKFSFDEHKPGF